MKIPILKRILATRATILTLIFFGLAISGPPAFSQPDPAAFHQRQYAPRTDVPPEVEQPVRPLKPIAGVWIIAGFMVVLAATGFLLFKAARVWQAANLFGRQYRFPTPDSIAPRFGGDRCGGAMATIRFRELLTVDAILESESENL